MRIQRCPEELKGNSVSGSVRLNPERHRSGLQAHAPQPPPALLCTGFIFPSSSWRKLAPDGSQGRVQSLAFPQRNGPFVSVPSLPWFPARNLIGQGLGGLGSYKNGPVSLQAKVSINIHSKTDMERF